jgi:hypothetical protein
MGVTVEWDSEYEVIRADFEAEWTYADYYMMLEQVVAMAASAKHLIDLIYVLPASGILPRGPAMTRFVQTAATLPANVGRVVFVGGNYHAQLMVSTFLEIYKEQRMRTLQARTLDEARALLRKGRSERLSA